ncbi:MAG: MFS transporter [Verrucomicrobiota bacterium]
MAEAFVENDGKWYDENGVQVWRAGTLVYYKKDLIRLFFWLYIGQFTFLMQDFAIPALFPLLMMKKGFNAAQIGTLWSIFPLGALLVYPILGTISDHARTRWGRRRPFDLLTTPVWLVGLIALPFVQNYWQAFAAMVLVGFAGAGTNVLISFYNDVVPPELMGRFSAGLRMFVSAGAILVQLIALRLFEISPGLVFIALALIGFIGEMLMLLMVKEGEYPPPGNRVSILRQVGGFIKEGFSNRYIIFLWLTLGVTALGGPVMGTYFNLFFTDSQTGLGLSPTMLGYLLAAGTAIGLVLILPAGWMIDWAGPKKIWGWCGFGVGLVQVLMFWFARDAVSIAVLFVAFAALNTMLAAALLPVMYSFIPKDKFGQLNGASQIITRVLQILGSAGFGLLIVMANQEYRYAFLAGGIAYMLVPLFLYLMLRQPYPYGTLKTSMNPDGKAGIRREGKTQG